MALPLPEVSAEEFLQEIDAYRRRIPLKGTVETTFRCNLNCVHCYVNEPAGSREVRERELPLERLLRLVDEIAEAGCLNLLLTGGEVLCRADFPDLYVHAWRRGLRIVIFTNGTLVTDRVADLLAAYPPNLVEITLYGATRETYERVTRVPGSFDRCLEGIRRLRERGVRLALKTAILTWNEHEFDAMRALADELGVRFRSDGMLNPRVDCGANRIAELQVPPERLVRLERRDDRRRQAFDGLMATVGEPQGATVAPREVYGCGAGLIGFSVDPYGGLHLCETARRNPFDLREATFGEGWTRHVPRVRARRWRDNPVCPKCSLLAACANCAGAAELEHGNPEAVVATFCELTHRRAFASLGDVAGHRADASCCLGQMSRLPAEPGRLETRRAALALTAATD